MDVPFLGPLVTSFATAVVFHRVQRSCKQDLHNLSKRTDLCFQKTEKVAESIKTVYQGLAYSLNELFKGLYWLRQTSARRWRVRSCCSVKQDDVKSCWVTALQLIGFSFSLGFFYYLILGVVFCLELLSSQSQQSNLCLHFHISHLARFYGVFFLTVQ